MKLLFLTNLYPPHDRGGLEQLCQEMTITLRQRGHEIHVLTSQNGPDHPKDDEPDVVRSLHLEADIHYYDPVAFFTHRRQFEAANIVELRRSIRTFKPDMCVVWGMWNLSRALPHYLEKTLPGQVAYYIASYWPAEPDMHTQYWRLPAKRTVNRLAKLTLRTLALAQLKRDSYLPHLRFENVRCVSQYLRDHLVNSGSLPDSAQVLFAGIDPYPYIRQTHSVTSVPGQPLRLLCLGSLIADKGVHTAIEAMSHLKNRGLIHRVQLTIVGGGHPAYEEHLRSMSTANGLADHVTFVGRIPRSSVPAYLKDSDVLLFTSIWAEPMARSVMEAMAAGLLVIGSEVGGQVEMMQHGMNALTYRANDSEALASAIELVLREPELAARLAHAAKEAIMERFTLDRMARNFENWLAAIPK